MVLVFQKKLLDVLFLIISSKRLVTEWHERRTTSLSKADHEARRAFFRAATLELDLAETSLSKMDQIAKSIGLMSGLKGGHTFLFQNPLK